MKSLIPVVGFVSLASALPTHDADPIRVLPAGWKFELGPLEGPGCPKDDVGYKTRMTYGQNTVDGSEIYYQFIAYPHLQASVDTNMEEAHTWCETTIKYTELAKGDPDKTAADYLLRLHKVGTKLITTYELDDGVDAQWKFTYFPENGDEVVDTISVKGPYNDLPYGSERDSHPSKENKPFPLTGCGSTTFKFRTDLYLTANKKGAKGTVIGETHKFEDGKLDSYGSQQGFSFDWQKCSK